MEFKKTNQNKRWETVLILSLTVLLGLAGCGSSGPGFKDVESGKIPLEPGETEAVKKLLTDAGIPPGKFPVFVDRTGYDNAYLKQKILVENGHVIALRLTWTDLEHMGAAAALTECRILDLSLNQISEIRGLQEAKKLEELILVNNKIKEPNGLDGCIALKTLELPANELTAVPDLSNMPHLERLVLGNNRIRSLKNFKGGGKLSHLDLSLNKLTSLAGLPNLPNLTYLGLEENQLTTLAGLGELPQLRTVKLSNNHLESVEQLAAFPLLESVDLKSNKITALPNFQREIARLQIQGNPVATAVPKDQIKPRPKLVLPADAARVSSLPAINGRLYGGGAFHSKITKRSNFAMATPSSFRFEQSGKTLSGTAGLNFIPGLLNIKMVRVTISVETGRVRIYLKHPGDFKFVEEKYGKKQLVEVPNEDFMAAEASPGQPCTLQGLIMRPRYCKYEVVLEALDGYASGVSYVITDTGQ
jgi:hypothetical protein